MIEQFACFQGGWQQTENPQERPKGPGKQQTVYF